MSNSLVIDVPNVVKQNTPLRNVPSGSTSSPDYSVKYVPQTLTEEQQAQARANIGVGTGEQVQSDWNQTDTSAPDYIKNKPEISAGKPDKYESAFYIENLNSYDITNADITSIWSSDTPEILISNDGTTWRDGGGGEGVKDIALTIPAKGRLFIKAKTYPGICTGHAFRHLINCNLGGNIMSLRSPNFVNIMDDSERFYGGGFGGGNDNSIIDCSNLGMPRGTIDGAAWGADMFNGNTSLIKVPELPAQIVGQEVYERMFSGCTSLQEAPDLPATLIGDACYNEMFKNCTSLLKAPALPALLMRPTAYRQMFCNCTSLQEAPALPATTIADHCYDAMFSGCTSLVNGPSIARGMTLNSYGSSFQQFFDGCSSLRSVAELKFTKFTSGTEMYYLFHNCSSLHEIYCHATNIGSPNFGQCFAGLPSTGTFYCATGMKSTWEGLNVIPAGWTIVEM